MHHAQDNPGSPEGVVIIRGAGGNKTTGNVITMTFYRRYGKSILDIACSAFGLLVLLPLLFGVAALVRFKLGAPVFFRQKRPGFQGKPFELIKFRTMNDKRGADGALLPDAQRLTLLGWFLRKTSLDELPELWNVLKGDMSLVGPRPLLLQYMCRYTPEQMRRHEVKPGITGWAQINGRQDIKLSQRIELDIWYVENLSLLLDIKIMFRSAIVVFCGTGIQQGQGPRTLDDLRSPNECIENNSTKIQVKNNY